MRTSVFLSHNSADKPFARRLASDLENQGITAWIDEAEIKAGESLIEKIRNGIDNAEYVVVILSPRSISSPWVQREVDVAMTQEILGKKIKVIPLMLEKCDLPGFLLGKKYSDFTNESEYADSLSELVKNIGIVFNRTALDGSGPKNHLGLAIDRASTKALPYLIKPFHRPYQYMGMTVADAAKAVNGTPNEVGNIIVDSDECHMLLEAEGNFINYVDIDIKNTAPHFQDQDFESEPILGTLSINPAELELVRKKTHCHVYYDHRKKLKISVMCVYDGGPLSVGFSSKYYGM